MQRYNDYDYFELKPGECAHAYYCGTCGHHYQWKEELFKCVHKHKTERRAEMLLTGDED